MFTHNGKSSLGSALPAIVNSVQDTAIRRWAKEIAKWGHPLYLTVLPSVDRNYVASSAVANGGVPPDSARAWAHIRRIFDHAHADNVAWTWQPAAPSDGTRYRPSTDQIDVVAVTWVQYPGTQWVIPNEELDRIQLTYPHKPLLVTLAAAGDPNQVGAWIGAAVSAAKSYQAIGLVYQTDGPDPYAARQELAAWRAGAYLTAQILGEQGVKTLSSGASSPENCGAVS